MSLDKKRTKELKDELIEIKNKLKKDLDIIAEPVGDNGEYRTKFEDIGEHRDENATEVENFTDNIAIKENLEKQLKNVDIALTKIEKGVFGVCDECGGEIDEKRLKINPSARRCINCAQ